MSPVVKVVGLQVMVKSVVEEREKVVALVGLPPSSSESVNGAGSVVLLFMALTLPLPGD